jgi:hypothetical protein
MSNAIKCITEIISKITERVITMDKWFFADNGKVTAPLDLEAAKAYLADNPNVYGWHPSFSQWMPVNCILEFVDVIPPSTQSLLVPKELTEKFLAKKQRLETKLTSIEDSVKHTQSSLNKFEKQISDYKELTINLNDDVKGAITNIERKYSSLNKKLEQVKNAVNIAEVEISDAITVFDQRINSNDVFMPTCNPSEQVQENIRTASENAKLSKAKLAQAKLATPHERVSVDKNEEKQSFKQEAKAQSKPPVNQKTKEVIPPDVEYANKMASESINSMKNMVKSVFKGDKKVEKKVETKDVVNKSGKEEPLSMAERLKLAQNNS